MNFYKNWLIFNENSKLYCFWGYNIITTDNFMENSFTTYFNVII